MIGAVACIMLFLSTPLPVVAEGVLRPESSHHFLDALQGIDAPIEIRSVQVGPVVVQVEACAPDTGCFGFAIGRGGPACPNDPGGPWCVSLPDALPGGLAAAIRSAVGSVSPDAVWFEPPVGVEEDFVLAPEPTAPVDRWAWRGSQTSAVVVTLLVPLVGGFAVGAALRWGRRRSRRFRLAADVVFVLVVGCATWWGLPASSLADVLLTVVVAVGGFHAGVSAGWIRGPVRLGAGVALAGVILLALEGATRLLLPSPPEMQNLDPKYPGFLLFRGDVTPNLRWSLMDPDGAASREAVGPRDPAVPVVLHLGNSVVEGVDVPPSDRFVEHVDAVDVGVRHVNLAVGGTGPDYAWVLARNWIAAGRVDQVVLYLHPNAIDFIGTRHLFCEGPIVESATDGPAIRCSMPAPSAPARMARRRRIIDGPFVLLKASRISYLARHLCTAQQDELNPIRNTLPGAVRRELLSGVLEVFAHDLSAAGIPWMTVILPGRPELEGDTRQRHRHAVLVDMAREVAVSRGVPVLDATPVLAGAAGDDLEGLFVDLCCHLSVRGHDVMADWLVQEAVPVLEAQRRDRGGETEDDAGG